MRVNHKKVKQLLSQVQSKITDRQFFTSRMLAGHYEDMAAAQTRRYQYYRRIHMRLIWKPRDENLAQTDNMYIVINTGHKRVIKKNRTRQDRYHIVTGIFAHELGHVLFTDFIAGLTYNNSFTAYQWYPRPPKLDKSEDIRREKELWAYVKADPVNLEMLQCVAHFVGNIVEDGYIESRMLTKFPGLLGFCLNMLRKQDFESMPTVTQLIEAESDAEQPKHIFESIAQIILSYVKYGEIKYGETALSDERIGTVFGLIPELDEALCNPSGKERWNTVNRVLVRCWDYIKDYIDTCKAYQQALEDAGINNGSTAVQTMLVKLQATSGSTEESVGTSGPVSEGTDAMVPVNSKERAETKALAVEKESLPEGENSYDAAGDGDKAVEDNTAGDHEDTNMDTEHLNEPSTTEAADVESIQDVNQKQTVSAEEQGRIPYEQTDYISEPYGGTVTYNEDYERIQYEHAASDIERLLESMAEKQACAQLENERLQALNDAAQNISYGDIHKGVNIHINRISQVDERLIEQYETIASSLLTIAKLLEKSLLQQLKENQSGGKLTGMMMGRRLDTHVLYRRDGKVFYKNTLPGELPQLSVGLLLDESGSMSSCDRCTYARAAAIILYEFCSQLRIPIMIYGHSTGNNCVEMYSYAEFESFDGEDKYRLMDISARRSNRDGAALRYVAEQLVKRTESVRLLILVSDGQPADIDYGGSAAEEDLRGIYQEYRRKGLVFIAAAIGEDKQNIERIYGDAYLDITDLERFPVKLTSLVKKFIRV